MSNRRLLTSLFSLVMCFNFFTGARASGAELAVASAKVAMSVYTLMNSTNSGTISPERLDQAINAINKLSSEISDLEMQKLFARAIAKLTSYREYHDDWEKEPNTLSMIAGEICELRSEIETYIGYASPERSLYLAAPYFALHAVEIAIEETMIKNGLRPEEIMFDKLNRYIDFGLTTAEVFHKKWASLRDCQHSAFDLYLKINGYESVKKMITSGPMPKKHPMEEKFWITCPDGEKVEINWIQWAQWHVESASWEALGMGHYRTDTTWTLRSDKAAEVCDGAMRKQSWYTDYLSAKKLAYDKGDAFDCRFNHDEKQVYNGYYEGVKLAVARLEAKKGSLRKVSNSLPADKKLHIDEKIVSLNGRYHMLMQGDHNLVVYRSVDGQNRPVWASNTRHAGCTWAIMQKDGNFVLYSDKHAPKWCSNTSAKSDQFLLLKDDGRVCLYGDDKCLWSTDSAE